MATTLYLVADAGPTTDAAALDRLLATSEGGGLSNITASTTASGDHIQLTASGSTVAFGLAIDAVTISGTISFSIDALESSMSANATVGFRVCRYSAAGAFISDVVADANAGHKDDAELGTSASTRTWTATPTSTAFSAGDILVVIPHADASGTMGDGYTVTAQYDEANSFVTFTETITEYTASSVLVEPTPASLDLATATPAVTAIAPVSALPTAASLTLTTATPAVALAVNAQPTAASLAVTGAVPAVAAGGAQLAEPTPASLTLAGAVPSVVAIASILVQPTPASLALTAMAPSVILSDHKLAEPTPASLSLAGAVPAVTAIGTAFVTPGPLALTLTGAVPVVSLSELDTMGTVRASLTGSQLGGGMAGTAIGGSIVRNQDGGTVA